MSRSKHEEDPKKSRIKAAKKKLKRIFKKAAKKGKNGKKGKLPFAISDVDGQMRIRSAPPEIKRVPVAIKNSGLFSGGVKLAKVGRELLAPILLKPDKGNIIHYRTLRVFRKFLETQDLDNPEPVNEIPVLNGLSLNGAIEWQPFIKVAVTVSRYNGQLQMHLPAFDPTLQIKAPRNTVSLQLQVALAAMQLDNLAYQDAKQIIINMPFEPGIRPAEVIALPTDTGTGRLCLVALTIRYFTGLNEQGMVDKLEWKPAGIVGSFYN